MFIGAALQRAGTGATTVNKPLTKSQRETLQSLIAHGGSRSTKLGMDGSRMPSLRALSRRGLVAYSYADGSWTITQAGITLLDVA